MPALACGSHWYVYVPGSSFTVTLLSPLNDTSVTSSSTPGPIRWKLWMSDLSSTFSVYVPAFTDSASSPLCFTSMSNPGPTSPSSVPDAEPATVVVVASVVVVSPLDDESPPQA